VTILALDTTSSRASLALRRDGVILSELALDSAEGYAHLIFQAIDSLLSKAGIHLQEIDCFAAASGPGSFTGVRVGLAAVKGLAAALDKPAAGISNLRALASYGNLRPAIDARRGEVYTAVYDARLRLVSPETVGPFPGLPITPSPNNLAAAVALCAEMDGPAGWQDPAALDANYVRRADAELSWKDR
jgi:tRNA threonylcarbamoyladenosine biosynthesis protein TsaB